MTGKTPADLVGFWERMRRRKVVQWGLAYLAGAWGLLQGIGFVADAFRWPAVTTQVATLAFLIGLPVVLVLAWYHGDRGEQRVSAAELTIITLLFLLGGGLFWRYEQARDAQSPPAVTVAPSLAPAIPADPRPSIAVIPFDNRSADPEDAFFVDGVHDDLLTQLAKLGAFRVIARTSVEHFRDSRLTMREIGEKLGATKILEGGIQRAGGRIRVTVQLVDAPTDTQQWAESYDRDLTVANLFAIQSEVAAAIADALETRLTPAQQARVAVAPTQNLTAWEDYQLGRQWLEKRTSAGVTAAIDHFEKAVAADPDFALAHAALGAAFVIQGAYEFIPSRRAYARAEEPIDRALALDPDLAEARAALGVLHTLRGNLVGGEAELRKAIKLNPNYATAHQWYSSVLTDLGRVDEALQAAEKAQALDPLSVVINNNLGNLLGSAGRTEQALAAFRRAIAIDPSLPIGYTSLAAAHAVLQGRFDEGIPLLEEAAELDPSDVYAVSYQGYQYLNLGDDARAARFLDRARQLSPEGTQPIDWTALLHLYRGEAAQARDYARRSFASDPRGEAWSIKLLRNAELAAGNAQAARARYAAAFPELLAAAPPTIDTSNLRAAVDLAFVLQQTGEHERARLLLDRGEEFIRSIPRVPWNGYWIADAEIHALRGREREALAALRAAESAGWRSFWRYYRDFEPNLAAIRNEPEFKAVFADIERDMAEQRARLAARPEGAAP